MRFWILVIGMAAVTYLPRLLPLVTLTKRPLPPLLRRILLYIPYTALGALIIPGVWQAIPGRPEAAMAGIGAAAVCSWFKGSLIVAVIAAVGVAWTVLQFLP